MVREKVRSNAFRRYKNKEGYLEIRYYYDPFGQPIKSIKTINSKPSGTTLFLMSGMIEQARAKLASGGKQLASIDFHTLGLDLAGSLTATGGVGSVLATSKTQTSGYYTRTYLYDGNGNVISLCKPDTGTITANYTYSPFGKLIKSEGINQSVTDFTFSTKYADETGLSYYGFRFYSAELGRWLKKDPLLNSMLLFPHISVVSPLIQEYIFSLSYYIAQECPRCIQVPSQYIVGVLNENTNLYGFVNNLPHCDIDIFGLRILRKCPKGAKLKNCSGRVCEYRTKRQFGCPTANGCGAEGGIPVPDLWFTTACNAHDICYGTCGKKKGDCDNKFYDDMIRICDGLTDPKEKKRCRWWALKYYGAVVVYGGDAYESAQDEYCLWQKCCK